jgi:hypothetical protein
MYVICWFNAKVSDWETAETIEEAKHFYFKALEETSEDNIYVFTNANYLTMDETKNLFEV